MEIPRARTETFEPLLLLDVARRATRDQTGIVFRLTDSQRQRRRRRRGRYDRSFSSRSRAHPSRLRNDVTGCKKENANFSAALSRIA